MNIFHAASFHLKTLPFDSPPRVQKGGSLPGLRVHNLPSRIPLVIKIKPVTIQVKVKVHDKAGQRHDETRHGTAQRKVREAAGTNYVRGDGVNRSDRNPRWTMAMNVPYTFDFLEYAQQRATEDSCPDSVQSRLFLCRVVSCQGRG